MRKALERSRKRRPAGEDRRLPFTAGDWASVPAVELGALGTSFWRTVEAGNLRVGWWLIPRASPPITGAPAGTPLAVWTGKSRSP